MTLRDIGEGFSQYWAEYTHAVVNLPLVDWPISFIFVTAIFLLPILSIIVAFLRFLYAATKLALSTTRELLRSIGVYKFIDMMDKRFGYYWPGILLISAIIGLQVIIFLLRHLNH